MAHAHCCWITKATHTHTHTHTQYVIIIAAHLQKCLQDGASLYIQCLPSEDFAVFCLNCTQQTKVCHPAFCVLTHMYMYVCMCACDEVVT